MTVRLRSFVVPTLAGLALVYLAAMAATGMAPQRRQLVRFEAAGLMTQVPAAVANVVIEQAGARYAFTRTEGGWRAAGVPMPAARAEQLELALKLLHTARAVRTLARGARNAEALAEFGLEPPRYVVRATMTDGGHVAIAFGKPGAEEVLQYARVEGSESVELLSSFVGDAWQRVVEASR